MAKVIDLGLAKEDDEMFSQPLRFCTVKRASDYLEEIEKQSQSEDSSKDLPKPL